MDGPSPTIPSITTEQLLINNLGCMQPMEASTKRGRGQNREKQIDSQKFHSNTNILEKSPVMIQYTQMYIEKVHYKYKTVGSCLATKVFIGNFLAMGRGSVIIK